MIPIWRPFLVLPLLPFLLSGISPNGPSQLHAFYLSSRGNDRNEGSRAHPWKTLARVSQVRLEPGDSVILRAGGLFQGTLNLPPGEGGTASAPIWIGSLGGSPARILAGDSSGIVLYRNSYIVLQNLRLEGSGRKTGNIRNGLAILNCDHILVSGMDISGFQKSGLLIYSSSHIMASEVFAHENGAAGITVEGENKRSSRYLQIIDCQADDNPGDPTNLTNHSGNGIVAGHCTNLVVDHCSATNNGWGMPRIGNGPVGIWCYESDSVIIEHCLSYRNKTAIGAADGGGFDLDGGTTNSIIQYCLSYGNQGSGYCIFQYWGASPWYHNTIRFNISENDGTVSDSRAAIYIWNSSGDSDQFYDCVVYNNTIYCSREAAISYSEKSLHRQFRFYNNILVGGDSLVRGNKKDWLSDDYAGNDWWLLHPGSARSSIHPTSFEKDQDLFINPGFRAPGHSRISSADLLASYGTYRLLPNSPLKNAGVDLFNSFGIPTGGRDFNGQRPPARGIGASF